MSTTASWARLTIARTLYTWRLRCLRTNCLRNPLTSYRNASRLPVATKGGAPMRAVLAFLVASGSLLLAGSFTGTATADAPNLDLHISGNSAVANYQLTPTTTMTVVAADLVSLTGEK